MAFFPLGYVYAGALLPDLPLTVFIAAALLCVLLIVRPAENSSQKATRRGMLLAILAGLLTGLSYLVKEYAILFAVPACAILATTTGALLSRQRILLLIAFAAGIGLVLLSEILLFRIVTQTWVFRADIGADPVNTTLVLRDLIERQGIWPWDRVAFLYGNLQSTIGWWSPLFAAAFLVYPFINRIDWPGRSASMAIFVSGAWLGIYLLLGSSSLSEYLPPPIVDRYYVILVPFVIPATADVLVTIAERLSHFAPRRLSLRRYGSSVTILLIAAFIALFAIERLGATQKKAGDIYRARDVASFLAAYRDAAVAADLSGLPVILSHYHAGRTVQLFPDEYRHLGASFGSAEPVQNLVEQRKPFLYVAPLDESKQGPPDSFLKKAKAEGRISIKAVGRGRYYPPVSRWNELRNHLSPLSEANHASKFGSYWDIYAVELMRIDPAEPGAATENAEDPSDPTQEQARIWLSLSEGFAVHANSLVWGSGEPGRRGYFQLFDRRSFKIAPESNSAELPDGTTSIAAGITIAATDPVNIMIHLYGYSGDILVNQDSQTLGLTGGQRETISLAIIGSDELQAYKIRLGVSPKNSARGMITLDDLTITSSVEESTTAKD